MKNNDENKHIEGDSLDDESSSSALIPHRTDLFFLQRNIYCHTLNVSAKHTYNFKKSHWNTTNYRLVYLFYYYFVVLSVNSKHNMSLCHSLFCHYFTPKTKQKASYVVKAQTIKSIHDIPS